MLWIDFDRSLQQLKSQRIIPILERRVSAFVQLVSLQVRRRRWTSGYRALDRNPLRQVREHSTPEGQIISGALSRQFALSQNELALCGKRAAFQLVARLVLGVVPLHGKRQGSVSRVLGRKFQLDAVGVLARRAEFDGLKISVVLVRFRQRELRQGQIQVRLLF